MGITPTKGNQTLSRGYVQVTPTAQYVEATTSVDGYGRPIRATDANGNATLTAYEPFYGYARVITNALGQTVTTMTDPRWGVPLVITDSNGVAVTQQYDDYGRRTSVWLPTEPTSGIPTYQYVYAPAARPAVVQQRRLMQRDAAVYQQSWTYVDGLGREIQTQRPDVTPNTLVASSKTYDAAGRVLYTSSPFTVTGTAGNSYLTPTWSGMANYSRAGYDDLGNQTLAETKAYTNVLWSTTSRFDAWQQRRTDANGNSVDQSNDAFGKLIAVTEYNTGNVTVTTQYAYDTRGSLTRVIDALTNTTVITYDLLGRKAGMFDPDMGAWTYGYDANGSLMTQTDARNLTLWFGYDALNRLQQKRIGSIGGTLLSDYGYDGQYTPRIEAEQYSSQTGSTGTDYKNAASAGQVLGMNWGGGAGNYVQYDQVAFGLQGVTTTLRVYYANATGHDNTLQVYIDGGYKGDLQIRNTGGWGGTSGEFMDTMLDLGAINPGLHALKIVAPVAGSNTNIDYYAFSNLVAGNPIGHRTVMSSAAEATRWTYDLRGRVATEALTINGAGTYTTSYAYDAADRVLTTTYPSGEAVGTGYDTVGQPYSLTGLQSYVISATYNPLGQPVWTYMGNLLKTRYLYFGIDVPAWNQPAGYFYGRLRRICVQPQANNIDCEGDVQNNGLLFNMGYNYDTVGNITTVRDDTKGLRENYSYDALNRLTSVYSNSLGVPSTIGYFNESYGYDAISNILMHTRQITTSATTTQTLGYTAGKPHAATTMNGEQRYWYDANGNMTVRVEISDSQRITYTQGWDIDNRLVAVTNTLGTTTIFAYDADGQRVARSDISGTAIYIGQYYEVQLSTGITTSYYSFGGQRVAMRTGSTVYWLQGDHLGSTSLTTNINGQTVSEMRYYSFGEVRWQSGSSPTDHTFTGQRMDPNLGGALDYGARFYLPGLGRFMSPDSLVPGPSNPQSLNRYSYSRNSPLTRIDPTGHGDICNSKLYNCGGNGSDDPAETLPSPNVVRLDHTLILHTFRKRHVEWRNIPKDFQAAMEKGHPGFKMQGLYEDELNGSAKSLPVLEHPGTWLAAGVAGGHACVAFCSVVADIVGTGTGVQLIREGTLEPRNWREAELMLSHVLKTSTNTMDLYVESLQKYIRPDFVNLEEGFIADSKFVQSLYVTGQLKAIAQIAKDMNVRFDIYARVGTEVSSAVQALVEETGGDIIRIFK